MVVEPGEKLCIVYRVKVGPESAILRDHFLF